MNTDELIKSIILQVVGTLNKKIVLFISGGAVNLKSIFSTLASFKLAHFDIVMSQSAVNVIPEDYINSLNGNLINNKKDMTLKIKESDLILIPVMTRNSLTKIAMGISDNLLTLGVAEALMLSKKIIAVNDSYSPVNEVNKSLGYSSNAAYNELLLQYENTLKKFGVEITDSHKLKECIDRNLNYSCNRDYKKIIKDKNICENKCESRIVTADDIVKNLKENSVLLREDAIITPLAKDFIYNKKIKIKYFR